MMATVTPREEVVDRPPLNTLATVEVGETLVAKGRRSIRPAIVTEEPVENWFARFPPQTFVLGYQSEKHNWYLADEAHNTMGAGLYPVGNAGLCISRTDPSRIGFFNTLGACNESKAVVPYKHTEALSEGRPSLSQELIYSGRSGSTIRIVYREFVNDYARPAFTQELTYDLNEGSEIGFRGVRIQVVEATNTKIVYRVVSSFSPRDR